jgi:hypothetical protein
VGVKVRERFLIPFLLRRTRSLIWT